MSGLDLLIGIERGLLRFCAGFVLGFLVSRLLRFSREYGREAREVVVDEDEENQNFFWDEDEDDEEEEPDDA